MRGGVAGIANFATICSADAVGLIIATDPMEEVAKTTAHELGHILNLDHDTTSCRCQDASRRCIMWPFVGFSPQTTWSECSTEDTRVTLFDCNYRRCLTNRPNRARRPRCTDICGGVLHVARSGQIQSPGFPDSTYPVNTTCEWLLRTDADFAANREIRFTFDSRFGIRGRPPRCRRDYLEIQNGLSGNSLGRFCSRTRPNSVTTSTNRARVRFNSEDRHGRSLRGFRLIYSSV